MDRLTTTESVDCHLTEYRALIEKLDEEAEDPQLRRLLRTESEWSAQGAAAVVMLARHYGTFVLAHALALAEALEIEDGDCGI